MTEVILNHKYETKNCYCCKRTYFVLCDMLHMVECPYCAQNIRQVQQNEIARLWRKIGAHKGVITRLKNKIKNMIPIGLHLEQRSR